MSFLSDIKIEVKAELNILKTEFDAILYRYNNGAPICEIIQNLTTLFGKSRTLRYKYNENMLVLPDIDAFVSEVYIKLEDLEQFVANNASIN